MKKLKLKVEVEIWGIEAEETSHHEDGTGRGWWKFEYSIKVDGGKKKIGEMDGSWSNQTKRKFTRALNKGYAVEKVLQKFYW